MFYKWSYAAYALSGSEQSDLLGWHELYRRAHRHVCVCTYIHTRTLSSLLLAPSLPCSSAPFPWTPAQ